MTTATIDSKVTDKIQATFLIDQFNLEFLELVINKMKQANSTLLSLTEKTIELQKPQISDLLSSIEQSEHADNNLQKLISNRSELSSSLKSLLGLVQLSVLLENKLLLFQNLFNEYKELLIEQPNREQLIELFSHYGVSLAFLWKIYDPLCQDVNMKEVFETVILNKNTKKAL